MTEITKDWDVLQDLERGINKPRLAAVNGKVTTAVWPEPDMSIAERTHVQPPDMPLYAFGAMEVWIEQAAAAASAPADYTALGLLCGTSGMIGGRRWVSPWAGWEEPCILWGAAIGDPSVNKSPAIDPVRRAVTAAEKVKAEGFKDQEAQYEADKAAAEIVRAMWEKEVAEAVKKKIAPPPRPAGAADPKKPAQPRCWVSNVTTEKLARIMSGDPGGVLAWTDELAGLIGFFDRYGGGGMDRAFWLEAYGGRPGRLDRVKDGTIDIPCNAASILGSIQPDRLHSLILSGDNDGFASRFLYAWPAPRPRKRPRLAPDWDLVRRMFERLAVLDYDQDNPKVLGMEPEAADAFEHWWEGEHSKSIDEATGVLREAYGKMSGTVLRVALALEYTWWAARDDHREPDVVSYKALALALILIDRWAKPMAARVLAEASVPTAQRQAVALARWVLTTKPLRFNARTVLRKHRGKLPGINETKDMDEACAGLTEAGWLRQAEQSAGRGRRPKDFEVNPAVLSRAS